MKDVLMLLRTLLGYAICICLFIIPFVIFGIFAILRLRYAQNILLMIDIAACSICHGVIYRTISAWSYQHKHKKRYLYQVKFIDFLAGLFGDGPDHCKRAYEWENKHNLTSIR